MGTTSLEVSAIRLEGLLTAQGSTEYLAGMLYLRHSCRVFLDMLIPNRFKPRQAHTPLLMTVFISPGDIATTVRASGVNDGMFPGMAHDMMLKAGWQTVADRILMWLDKRDL